MLDPDLLTGDRDGCLDILGDDVLAQTGAAGFHLLGSDVQALLRTSHCVIARRTADITPLDTVFIGRKSAVVGLGCL